MILIKKLKIFLNSVTAARFFQVEGTDNSQLYNIYPYTGCFLIIFSNIIGSDGVKLTSVGSIDVTASEMFLTMSISNITGSDG